MFGIPANSQAATPPLTAATTAGRTPQDFKIVNENFDQIVALNMAQDGFIAGISSQRPYDQGVAEATVGALTLMEIRPANGVIEIGHIFFSPVLQKTRAATEAIYLAMRHAFADLGYRRFEWKCDALNAPSRAAAIRFGFTFEGIFRQHMVIKGRNRDTAWYSITDKDWPVLKAGFEAWLKPENFDAAGHQKAALGALRPKARPHAQ